MYRNIKKEANIVCNSLLNSGSNGNNEEKNDKKDTPE